MNLPVQALPVRRDASTSRYNASAVAASDGPACTVCKLACNTLGGFAKTLCLMACDKTVC